MFVFQWTLVILASAVALTAVARRLGVPYPSLLALGGTALALLPITPNLRLDPSLTLALFVAPVLLDAAYDTSLRDLRANWVPVLCLVVIAVVITTGAVAWLVHALVPGMPWAAAIALGAIVAPPDAAAATAILRPLRLPQRVVVILEGESLLNDASALMIYRIAIASLGMGSVDWGQLVPVFALSIVGSLVAGFLLARLFALTVGRVQDAPSQIVLQFVGTFGIWILAEHLSLSPIVTVVAFGITASRYSGGSTPARLRVPSFAVWETVVFVLNVMAFVLIGLQLRPIISALAPSERTDFLRIGALVFLVVVLVRAAWIWTYVGAAHLKARWLGAGRWPGESPPTPRGALVVTWCGMRGIVTLAAAYALPGTVPYRDLLLFCAFAVVVGTLVVQGLTLSPLIRLLRFRADRSVDREVSLTEQRLARVAIETLDGDHSTQARAMRHEFQALMGESRRDADGGHRQLKHDRLRARVVAAQRRELLVMRDADEIGDAAFHQVEERLDWAELTVEESE